MPTPSATHVPRAPRQSSACRSTSAIAVVSIALVAPPPVWSRTASTTSSTSGSSVTVAPSSAASCRRLGTGSTTTIVGDAERPRRHDRREPHAAGAEHDERRALVELEHVHDRAGAGLHAAAERGGHAEVDVPPTTTTLSSYASACVAKLDCPKKRPVHGAAVRAHGRRPVRADAARVERREPRAVVRMAGGALRTCAAAPVAHHDGVAGPDAFDAVADRLDDAGALVPEHDRIAPGVPRMRGQSCRMLTSVWQIPQATSLTRISSARGSSSSTSWRVNGRSAAWATAASTITGEPYDRARLPLRGRGVGRAGERSDHGGHLSVHGRADRPRGARRIRRCRPRRARRAGRVRRRSVAANDSGRASGGPAPRGRGDRGPRGRARAADDARGRLADRGRRPAGRGGEALPRLARRPGRDVPVGGGPAGRLLEPAGAPRAGRRRRRDRPLELPARAHDAEAVPRAAHRLHRRAQAGGGDAALRVPARRDLRAGGAARPVC